MTVRTGDLAQFQRTTDNMLAVQNRLRTQNLHITTGKSVHRYSDLGAQTGMLIRAETALVETETFSEQNALLVNRLNIVDGALEEVKNIASSLQVALIARRTDAAGAATQLSLEAEGMKQRLINVLNIQIDGRYVFGGSRTDTPPVDAALLTDDPSNSDYYQGDQVTSRARIDTDAEAEYGVLGDDPAFRQLFAALQLAADGHNAADDGKLQTASDLAEQALDGTISTRARLNVATARVERVMESQANTTLYLKDTISRLTDTDVPTAMARISQDQVALEASFAVTAQLNRLNLTDYLR